MPLILEPNGQSLQFRTGSRVLVFGPDRGVVDGTRHEGRFEDVAVADDGSVFWTCRLGAAVLEHRAALPVEGRIVLTTRLRNPSGKDLRIGDLDLFGAVEARSGAGGRPWSRTWVSAQTMLGDEGVVVGDKEYSSYGYAGATAEDGSSSVLFGFPDVSEAFHLFRVRRLPDGDGIRVEPRCRLEGIRFAAGRSLPLSPLEVAVAEEGLSHGLEAYASSVAAAMGTRVDRGRETMTGWCSWYAYYGRETEADVLRNVRMLADSPLAGRLRVIQLDDGWNLPENGHPNVWGDWNPGPKFPRGMRAVSDDIRAAGFQAGLWLAPFTASPASRLRQEHPDWIVGSTEDSILKLPEYGLDLTHPEVLGFLRETFVRVFDEWGFDYVKLDFLLYGAIEGRRHDDAATSAAAFRRGMQVIREVAGDRFVLACGAPILQCAGLVDAMRLGPDAGARWALPVNVPAWPYGNCAIMPTAFTAFHRQFLHGILWQNDPDCIVVRGFGNEHERRMFGERFLGHPMTEADYGLSPNEAAFWAESLRMAGGMLLFSEIWDELPDDRRSLVLRCFERPAGRVRMVDWHPVPEVVVLLEEGADGEVGFFNMTDEDVRISLPLARLRDGLAGIPEDRLSGTAREVAVPARSAVVRSARDLLKA